MNDDSNPSMPPMNSPLLPKKGIARFMRPSSRAYWLATGVVWGSGAGVFGCLVAQAYVMNVSAAQTAAETVTIMSEINKSNLLLKMVLDGRGSVWVDDRGHEVFIAAGSDKPTYLLTETEKLLYRWASKPGSVRNMQELLAAIGADEKAGVRAIAPLAPALFSAASARSREEKKDRWIDDPFVISILTQTLAHQYVAQERTIDRLTLWPKAARCMVSVWEPCARSKESQGIGSVSPAQAAPTATPEAPREKPAGASEVTGL